MRVVLILLLSFTVSGCATLSKEECLTGNWEEIGFRDGTNGRTSDYLQSHAKACEKSDVRPVQSLWEKGRQRGLPAYCVPAKAYSEGKKGNELRPVCPATQTRSLRAANEKGLEYRAYNEEITQAQYRIDEIERSLIAEESSEKRALLVQERRALSRNIRLLELQRSFVSSL